MMCVKCNIITCRKHILCKYIFFTNNNHVHIRKTLADIVYILHISNAVAWIWFECVIQGFITKI